MLLYMYSNIYIHKSYSHHQFLAISPREKNIAILAYMSVKDIKMDCTSFQVMLSS